MARLRCGAAPISIIGNTCIYLLFHFNMAAVKTILISIQPKKLVIVLGTYSGSETCYIY